MIIGELNLFYNFALVYLIGLVKYLSGLVRVLWAQTCWSLHTHSSVKHTHTHTYTHTHTCTTTYRVFIKYCVFFRFFKNIPNSVFPRCQCVYTHQAGRKPALQHNWQSSEKSQNFKEKTQFLMNTLNQFFQTNKHLLDFFFTLYF